MAFLRNLSLFLAIQCSALAFPTSENVARGGETFKTSIFEKLTSPPKGWSRDEAATIDKNASEIKLRIHLVQPNMSNLHELAVKVFRAVSLALNDFCIIKVEPTV